MKQLLLLFIIPIILAACSDNEGTSDSTDSTSIAAFMDSSTTIKSTLVDDYESNDYANSEIINKSGTITRVTAPGQIFSDSLLLIPLRIPVIGEHLKIEKYCGTTTKHNWVEPVYKISCQLEEGLEYGYISQSHIACRLDTLKSKKIVVLTLDYNNSKEKFIGRISLLNQVGKSLATTSVEFDILKEGDAPYSYSYYFSFEEKKSTGLDGVTESFSLSTDYGACGYPGFEYTFLWNEKKLITCPEIYSITEAGQFYQYSYWVFPADSLGKEGSILNIIEGVQYEDESESENDSQIANKDSTVIEYTWNKYSFMSASGDTIVKKSRSYSVPTDY